MKKKDKQQLGNMLMALGGSLIVMAIISLFFKNPETLAIYGLVFFMGMWNILMIEDLKEWNTT